MHVLTYGLETTAFKITVYVILYKTDGKSNKTKKVISLCEQSVFIHTNTKTIRDIYNIYFIHTIYKTK